MKTKTKYTLKTVGLLSAISISSLFLLSCDGNDATGNTNTGNTNTGNTDTGNTDTGNTDTGNTDTGNTDTVTGLPADPSELKNGGVITLSEAGESDWRFVITDAAAGIGDAIGDDWRINNLNYSYDVASMEFTLTDNRVSIDAAIAELNQLLGDGGSAKDELDTLIAADNTENFEALLFAVNSVTDAERFSVEGDDQERAYILREAVISIADNTFRLSGIYIGGDEFLFTVGAAVGPFVEQLDSITYTAP